MINYSSPFGIRSRFQRWMDRRFQETASRLAGIAFPVKWAEPAVLGARSISLAELHPPELPRPIRGFAVDKSRSVLMIKALMEGLEGLAVRDAGLDLQSRTGMAAHFNEGDARESAYRELIERDALLLHWLSELPGQPVDLAPLLKPREFSGVEEANGLRAISLRSADPRVVVCFASSRSRFGCWHLGLGTGVSLDQALTKALGEWTASVFAHRLNERCSSETESANRSASRRELSAHHAATREADVAALLDHLFSPTPGDVPPGGADDPEVRGATSFARLLTRSPRYAVVRAENPRLLPLHFSESYFSYRDEYLALPRLAREIALRPPRFHPPGRFLPHPID